MTTIRTAFPQSEVQSLDALRIDRLRLNPSDRDVTNLQIIRGGPVVAGINVLTADLKAALGIDELGCGCDEADDNLKAAIRRAEDAEAFGAAAIDRAEKAEATVAAVREHVEDDHIWWPNSAQREGLRKILDPKPAFTLPTEAGAVVEYTDHHGSTQRWFRTRDTQRPWTDREGNTWHDAGLARDIAGDFTVLLGADQ